MLEEHISRQEPPFSNFPDEHKPLVAKLAHERSVLSLMWQVDLKNLIHELSDKTLAMLSKHIHHELLPTLDDEDDRALATSTAAALPLSLVENVIDEVLVRKNYGLEAPLGVRLPAAVSVWRWEVRNEYWDWLPKNSREKAESRQAERSQVSFLLCNTYDEL